MRPLLVQLLLHARRSLARKVSVHPCRSDPGGLLGSAVVVVSPPRDAVDVLRPSRRVRHRADYE